MKKTFLSSDFQNNLNEGTLVAHWNGFDVCRTKHDGKVVYTFEGMILFFFVGCRIEGIQERC